MAVAGTQRDQQEGAADPALLRAVERARARQEALYRETGLRLRLGKVLVILGELSEKELEDLRGTALVPERKDGQKVLEAELLGELALERGWITPADLCACVAVQVAARQRGEGHRPIGSLLVERGKISAKQLDVLRQELPAAIRLGRSRLKRLRAGAGAGRGLSGVDAAYVKAASSGRFDADRVLVGVERLQRLAKLLPEPLSLAEYLIVRGIVAPAEHLQIVRENRDRLADASFMLGTVLVELGYAKPQEVEQALKQRVRDSEKGAPRRLGETLVERGTLTAAELEDALRVQSHRRFGDPHRRAKTRARRRAGSRVGLGVALAVGLVWLAGPSLQDRIALGRVGSVEVGIAARRAAIARLEGRIATDERIAQAFTKLVGDRASPIALRAVALHALIAAEALPTSELLALVEAPEATLRARAAWAVGDAVGDATGDRAAARKLTPRLLQRIAVEPDEACRLALGRALALSGRPDSREALVRALAPPSAPRKALTARLALDDEELRAALAKALERLSGFAIGPDAERWEAWLSLQSVADTLRQGTTRPVEEFARLLRSEDPSLAFASARHLAHRGDARGLGLLVRALDAEDEGYRAAIAARGVVIAEVEAELGTLCALLTGEPLDRDAEGWLGWWASRRAPSAPSAPRAP